MTIKSITVYCSSSDKLSNKYYQDAEEISKLISSFKINIVYGGAKVGSMGVVAKTAKKYKNRVIGLEVVSWKVMGIHNKPIIFFNKNNFWDNLFQQFKFFEDEKFSNKNLQNSFHIIDTVDQLKNILIKWQK